MSQSPSVYDLTHPKMPRVAGGALSLLTALVESPITRPLLLPTLMANAGIPLLRSLRIDEPPTYMPFHDFTPPAKKVAPVVLDKIPKLARGDKGFRYRTVRDYAEAYRKGRITPRQVAERALEAIAAADQGDKPLRAYIAVIADDVLGQADAATKRIKAKKPLSLFDGVPAGVKDEVDVRGYPTSVGTRVWGKSPAAEDATVVGRLRSAGAIIFGRANMAEYGLSTNGLNVPYGTARNPHNLDHHTGGSSSGPAAAVAAGLCPVAIGADGGGSIRIPSSFCGLVGLMSTTGRVSEYGAAPIARSVGHLGPLGATAEDAALAYAAIAGVDARDPDTMHQPPLTLDEINNPVLRGVTLGVFPEWFEDAVPEVLTACQAMLDALKKKGAKVKEIAIPELQAAYVAHALTIVSEMATSMWAFPPEAMRELSPDVRIQFVMATSTCPADFVQAQRVRTRTMRHFYAAFEEVDAIVTPSVAFSAPAIAPDALNVGESDLTAVIASLRFTSQANLCGLPAISFPAGYDATGMPIGFQAIGKPWSEATLLRLAYTADALVERRKPQVYFDLLG